MPLSDHEQKMLEQMEQALAAEDPKFASQMQGSSLASLQRRRWLVGAVGVVVGLGLVLVGINTTMWVGAIGFAIMVAAAVFAATPPRRARLGVVRGDGTTGAPVAKGSRRKGQRSFMDRLDERWDKRQNNP
ncbi:spore wall synthesis complex protein [Fodinibacter luteus]|uniref:Spore wall synthesis complex protein n=1 Tax=Fodinibacter luteus TaxID=552064 RepID=A0ABP8KG09_9MICO